MSETTTKPSLAALQTALAALAFHPYQLQIGKIAEEIAPFVDIYTVDLPEAFVGGPSLALFSAALAQHAPGAWWIIRATTNGRNLQLVVTIRPEKLVA